MLDEITWKVYQLPEKLGRLIAECTPESLPPLNIRTQIDVIFLSVEM
jgi:hypothetical protein